MKKQTRHQDAEWRKIQHMVGKALTQVLTAFDGLRETNVSKAKGNLLDSLKVLAMMFTNLSVKRKENIGNDLAPSYKPLCAPSRSVTTFLFGDEVAKEMRELGEAYKLGAKVAGYQSRGGRAKPSFRGKAQFDYSGQLPGAGYGLLRGAGYGGKGGYGGRGRNNRRRGAYQGNRAPAAASIPPSDQTQGNVSKLSHEKPICPPHLVNTPANFRAGKTRDFLSHWQKLTSNKHIIDNIKGVKIDFDDKVWQARSPTPIKFSTADEEKMQLQLNNMLAKGII